MKIKYVSRVLLRVNFATIMLFVFITGHGQSLMPSPPKRAHHELIYDPASKIILMTGGSTPNSDNTGIFYNDIWSYDGRSWIFLGKEGDERSGIRLAYDSKRKKIYSFGGFTK